MGMLHLPDFPKCLCRSILWYGSTYAQILSHPHALDAHFMVLLLPPTTHNTTTTQTIKMSGRRPPSGGFCPSAWAGEICPRHHCAAAPLRVCAGREPMGLRLPLPVPLFGVPEWHPSKMREVGGASTLMATVRFKNTTINK